MEVGLRIDVDTYRGTKLGVPSLVAVLKEFGVHASFFFTVGPDNMGRHVWRLLRPAFLIKMLRSNAAGLYGWDILLRGTVLPGPVIGHKLAMVIRQAADAGHEIGFHAWDHHAWQQRIARMGGPDIRKIIVRGIAALTEAAGRSPTCSASPAWRCTEQVLLEKLQFPLTYNSDCRGDCIFQPVVGAKDLPQPQIPTTLPTYDEVIGRNGINENNYNQFLLKQLRPGKLNTLTIHAEVEGIRCQPLFHDFLSTAQRREVRFVPLGSLLEGQSHPPPRARIVAGTVLGREGWISVQAPLAGKAPSGAPCL